MRYVNITGHELEILALLMSYEGDFEHSVSRAAGKASLVFVLPIECNRLCVLVSLQLGRQVGRRN